VGNGGSPGGSGPGGAARPGGGAGGGAGLHAAAGAAGASGAAGAGAAAGAPAAAAAAAPGAGSAGWLSRHPSVHSRLVGDNSGLGLHAVTGTGEQGRMGRVGLVRMWQAQATVFPVALTVYMARAPYEYSKKYGFGQPQRWGTGPGEGA